MPGGLRRLECFLRHLKATASGELNGQNAGVEVVGSSAKTPRRLWSVEEIKKKRDDGLIFIAIHNKVYDVTEFADEHPGGREFIVDLEVDDLDTVNIEFDNAEHSEVRLFVYFAVIVLIDWIGCI